MRAGEIRGVAEELVRSAPMAAGASPRAPIRMPKAAVPPVPIKQELTDDSMLTAADDDKGDGESFPRLPTHASALDCVSVELEAAEPVGAMVGDADAGVSMTAACAAIPTNRELADVWRVKNKDQPAKDRDGQPVPIKQICILPDEDYHIHLFACACACICICV